MKKLGLLIITVFFCPIFIILSSPPLSAEQPSEAGKSKPSDSSHLPRTGKMDSRGLTVLSTMTGSVEDFYVFHDGDVPADDASVSGPGSKMAHLTAGKLYSGTKSAALQRAGGTTGRSSDYGKAIRSACKRYTVDPALVRAVIMAESNFNPEALSPKGAMGLMQLMPDTAREMGVSDPFDPVENIHGGVGYLSRLLKSLNGDLSLALAAYNAGPERVKNYNGIPPFQETWSYINRVLDYYQIFKGKK
jgi:hypothetical protein